MLDKWAFGMSKIDNADESSSKPGSLGDRSLSNLNPNAPKRGPSTDLAAEVSNVSLDTRSSSAARKHAPLGPSLLSQQALSASDPVAVPLPAPTPHGGRPGSGSGVSSSVMSVDPQSDSSSSAYEAAERITVKIADLGNGTASFFFSFFLIAYIPDILFHQQHGWNITLRMIFKQDSIGVQKSFSAPNGVRALTFGVWRVWSALLAYF
jgi:hypothetical protein